ncbi:hypothetical protein RFI_14974, partial [Reticulomyxa filosa]
FLHDQASNIENGKPVNQMNKVLNGASELETNEEAVRKTAGTVIGTGGRAYGIRSNFEKTIKNDSPLYFHYDVEHPLHGNGDEQKNLHNQHNGNDIEKIDTKGQSLCPSPPKRISMQMQNSNPFTSLSNAPPPSLSSQNNLHRSINMEKPSTRSNRATLSEPTANLHLHYHHHHRDHNNHQQLLSTLQSLPSFPTKRGVLQDTKLSRATTNPKSHNQHDGEKLN